MAINLDALYDKKCTCHYCKNQFLSKRVRSGSQKVLKRDTDFCTYYQQQLLNPIIYTVSVCPACGYAFTDLFSSFMQPHVRQRIRDNIWVKWQEKEYGHIRTYDEAIAAYKLAIYTAMLKEEAHSVKAGLYLRLAWLHRFQKNEQEELRFLNLAANEYEKSYVHSDYIKGDKEMSETRILYLIGELMRRVEKFDQAVSYFSRAVARKDRTIETGIISMARDQWSLAREEYKQKQASKQPAESTESEPLS